MPRALLLVLFLLLCHPLGAGAVENEASIAAMMRAVFEAKTPYKGMKTVIFWSNHGSDTVLCKTYRQGDATRFEYQSSVHQPARIVVQDKGTIRYYQPAQKLLISEERPGDQDVRMLDIAFKNYDWEVEGDAIVAGHHTRIIKTVHKTAGTVQQRLWIDPKHDVILRKESYNIRGEIYFASFFTEIDYPPNLDPGLFTLTMPSDTKEVIKKLPVPISSTGPWPAHLRFTPVVRATLPGGYELLEIDEETLTGHHAIRLAYSDGLDVVSLAELPANVFQKQGAGNGAKALEKLGRNLQFEALLEGNLLQWRDDHIFYTLVGSLPQDEMLAIYNDVMEQKEATTPQPPPSSAAQSHSLMFYFWRGLEKLSHIGR